MIRIFKFLIIYIICSTLIVPSLSAADPTTQLEVKIWTDGTVVFVKPKKMSRTISSTAAKDLEYDLSLNTLEDTVTFASTVITRGAVQIDSVKIGKFGSFPVEKMYTEPISSNMWRNRFGVKIPMDIFHSIVDADEAPAICFGGADFCHTNKKWQDCRRVYCLALEIIKQNKK